MALVGQEATVDAGLSLATRPDLSRFELFLTCNPPILESFLLQAPTSTILALYHTSSYLRQFIRTYPTSWKYLSFRIQQPQQTAASASQANGTGVRQSSNYALDQLLIYIVNPFSTCLTSLELDNTAVSGQILTQTVLHLRRDTLTHLSVRGCKNVSLKYHINPWLMLFALTGDFAEGKFAPKEFQQLALKSLYVYRCRHHRRRPYLPQSLTRKDSDSEPTHELVNICHKLGIWTDTAWCTTPGARCDRRKGYVSQRVPPDPREVWVVYDRLWRSKNWLGPVEAPGQSTADAKSRKRKRDGRSWEYGEDAAFGEPLGTRNQGKALPAHLRQSHRQFVENIICDNCTSVILERCEQCSVRMHCSGCRKTLCASCAFDRPYLRNKNASEESKSSIWWAPGCAVSPCSMQDQDSLPIGPGMNPPSTTNNASITPNLKLKWCCTEPAFSGGGGITFFGGSHPDNEHVKAAPLPRNQGWEDLEFDRDNDLAMTTLTCTRLSDVTQDTEELPVASAASLALSGRFESIDEMFYACPVLHGHSSQAPRNLCDECYATDLWKVVCKSCSLTICLRHDVREKMRVRICGYRDLAVEKMDFRTRQKLSKGKATAGRTETRVTASKPASKSRPTLETRPQTPIRPGGVQSLLATPSNTTSEITPSSTRTIRTLITDDASPLRSASPGSNSTGPPSRASSPSPSDDSASTSSEERNTSRRSRQNQRAPPPDWRGCQGFLCPPTRPPGDNRRRCLAVTRQCTQCKVHVCDTCLVDIGPTCPCKGCRTPQGTTVVNPLAGEPRFFCPNCQYDRMVNGECKRRIPLHDGGAKKSKSKHKKNAKSRKPFASRVTHLNPGLATHDAHFSGLNDEVLEQMVEFMESVQLSDANELPVNRSASSTQYQRHEASSEQRQETEADNDDDEENMQELVDMGALARDLVRRIQRLRGQLRPGSAAAAALPDLRMDDDVDADGLALTHDVPVVEEMD